MGGQGTASGKPGFPEAAAAISAKPAPTDLSGPQSSPAATPHARSLLLHVCCGPCAVMPITRLLGAGEPLPMWAGDRHLLPLVFDDDPRPFHGVMPYVDGRPASWTYHR